MTAPRSLPLYFSRASLVRSLRMMTLPVTLPLVPGVTARVGVMVKTGAAKTVASPAGRRGSDIKRLHDEDETRRESLFDWLIVPDDSAKNNGAVCGFHQER